MTKIREELRKGFGVSREHQREKYMARDRRIIKKIGRPAWTVKFSGTPGLLSFEGDAHATWEKFTRTMKK